MSHRRSSPLEAALVILLGLGLTACGGGGGSSGAVASAAFALSIDSPGTDVVVAETGGDVLEVRVLAEEPGTLTDLFLDADGNLSTRADRIPIAQDLPATPGAERTVAWEADGLAPGAYAIVALSRTESAFAQVQAQGRLIVNARATVAVQSPVTSMVRSRGGWVHVEYADSDPDDEAGTVLRGDLDGDPATTDAGDVLTASRPERGGATQRVLVSLIDVPADTDLTMIATTTDGINAAQHAVAAGQVEVRDVSHVGEIEVGNNAGVEAVRGFEDGSFLHVASSGIGFNRHDTGGPNETLVAAGLQVARYNADKTLAWARTYGNPSVSIRDVATHPDESFTVTGGYGSSVAFGATTLPAADVDLVNGFVAHFDASGDPVWATWFGGRGGDISNAIAVHPDGGTVVAGFAQEEATFGVGEPEEVTVTAPGRFLRIAFVARYGVDGSLLWLRQATARANNNGEWASFNAVAVRPDGRIVAVGQLFGAATIGPGAGDAVSLTSAGDGDALIAEFTAQGDIVWARADGGTSREEWQDVAILEDASVVLAGAFGAEGFTGLGGAATYGAGQDQETNLASGGGEDFVIARYTGEGVLAWARGGGSSAIRSERAQRVRVLGDGSFVVTGYAPGVGITPSQVVLSRGEPDEVTVPVLEGTFLARYRPDGALLWGRGIDNTPIGWAKPTAIWPMPDGSLLVSAIYEDEITFGAGQPNEVTLETTFGRGAQGIFITLLNADGDF